jgi:hypothetical protein
VIIWRLSLYTAWRGLCHSECVAPSSNKTTREPHKVGPARSVARSIRSWKGIYVIVSSHLGSHARHAVTIAVRINITFGLGLCLHEIVSLFLRPLVQGNISYRFALYPGPCTHGYIQCVTIASSFMQKLFPHTFTRTELPDRPYLAFRTS